jgi:GT2 family glycosyltransferase
MTAGAGGHLRKVVVAILSWNGRAHLETCLAALAEQEDPGVPWEVLVLDNGSTDGTAAWLESAYPTTGAGSRPPRVRVIASPLNLGFCGGNNRLVAAAEDADAVALLNNDTRPQRDWLANLVAALASAPADVAAVSGLIVDWEGERLDFAQGVMTFDGHAFQPGFRRPLANVQIPVAGSEMLFACGGNMLIRRAAYLAAGGFDESYFAYLEDVDLGWRLWQGGERVVFAPAAVVHHRSSATSDLLGLFNRGFLFERNAWLNAYKNFEAGVWEKMMPLVELVLLARTQAMLVENNPAGVTLTIDPYAGVIANTGGSSAAVAAQAPAAARPPRESLGEKWRRFGPREFARRGLAKAWRSMAGAAPPALAAAADPRAAGPRAADPRYPQLTDERTIAQFRAINYLLRNLDAAAASRQRVQARRVRGDREIFERFPLYVVPTYPGDWQLFHSAGFAAWLPTDVAMIRATLQELMEP